MYIFFLFMHTTLGNYGQFILHVLTMRIIENETYAMEQVWFMQDAALCGMELSVWKGLLDEDELHFAFLRWC